MKRLLLACLAVCQALPAQAPPASFNVRSYGATGDGTTLDTAAINRAIDACAEEGGGTVHLPAGTYLSGTVRLRSNVMLWLESGATLRGTRDLAQYQTAIDGQVWYQALILAKGVHHVAIGGRGTIDGNKVRNPKGEERMRGPHAVLLYQVRDASVRDVFIQDAGNYALILRSSERVNIDGITVRGGWDGINMHDTRNATIANCRIYSGDDSLAGAYWENVTVSNCILNSSANAVRVGGRHVLFTNLVIYGPGEYPAGTSQRHRLEAGFQILPHRAQSPNGGEGKVVAAGPIDDMVISNVSMTNAGTPIYIAYSSDASYSANNLGVGRIVFNNLTATGAGLTPVYVSAPRENPAKSIVLNNVRITTRGGADETQAQGQGFSPFSILQAYGVYCRNVNRLELHDVRFDYERKELRPALFADHVGTVELDRFEAKRDPAGAPSIQLAESGKLLLDGKPAAAGDARVVARDLTDPFRAGITVENAGRAGLVEVDGRQVWLEKNEKAQVWFLNLRPANAAREEKPVAEPYRVFQNTQAEASQVEHGFYLRAAGDYPLLQFGDQYAATYRPRALPRHGAVTVKLENPDLRTNWVGRVGIMVRNDISKPGQSHGYAILASSPAAGPSLEWDEDGSGRLDRHTEFDGYTIWPHWLKLVRDGASITGFNSTDGAHWTEVGKAKLADAEDLLDAGIFAFRDSARFVEFRIEK